MDSKYSLRDMMNRIINLMAEAGMSAADLASVLGISKSAVHKWMKYQTTPKAENIVAMAYFFRVTTDYLLIGKKPTDDEIRISRVKARTEKESTIIKQYRELPENYQDMVSAYTNGLYIGRGKGSKL